MNTISSSDQTSQQLIHVKVEVLGYLRTIIGKKEFEVELRGTNTIGELVETLSTIYGEELNRAIVGSSAGQFLVLILINGKDIDFLQKSRTSLSDGDNVTIVPLVAGG